MSIRMGPVDLVAALAEAHTRIGQLDGALRRAGIDPTSVGYTNPAGSRLPGTGLRPGPTGRSDVAQLGEVVKVLGEELLSLISWREGQSDGIRMGRGPDDTVRDALKTLPGGEADAIEYGDDWRHRHPELIDTWQTEHTHYVGQEISTHTHDHTGWSDK
jgi:hypothetical protein